MVRQRTIAAVMMTLLLGVVVCGSATPVRPAKSRAKAAKTTPATLLQAGTTLAQTFGSYWQVSPSYSTTLILQNTDAQNPVAVNVLLFSTNGQLITGGTPGVTAQLQLAANGTQQVALSSLLPGDGAVHAGGLAVQFASSAPGVTGQVVITSNSNGTSVHLPLTSGYALDTANAVYAPWWLADAGTDGNIELFNSSSQAIVVTPWVTVQGVEQSGSSINVAANASQSVSLRSLLAQANASSATVGAITLRYSGAAHAVQPALILANTTTGFWMTSGFHALRSPTGTTAGPTTAAAASTTTSATTATAPNTGLTRLQFAELKLQWSGTSNPLHGYALLSNSTKVPMNVELEAHFPSTVAKDPMQKVRLPVGQLAPLETRLVDLSQFVTNGTITGNPSRMGLVASHPGTPGDLALTLFSVNPGTTLAFPAPGTILSSAVADVSYWEVGNKKESPKAVRNPLSTAAQGQVILYYPTAQGMGSYVFPVMQLPAASDQKVTLGHITRTPDARGLLAPKGTKWGMATLLTVPAGSSSAMAAAQELCQPSCMSVQSITAAATPPAGISSTPVTGDVIVNFNQHIHFNQHFNQNQTCNPPTVSSITTDSTPWPGSTVTATINGSDFPAQGLNVTAGQITVSSPQRVSDTEITATFTIPFNSGVVGTQTVTVSGPYGSGDGTFDVPQPGALVLEQVSPNSGTAGTDVPVLLDVGEQGGDGSQPHFQSGDQISVGGGITATVDSVSTDGTMVNATFHIPLCGAFGSQSVTLTDIFGQTSNSATFTVNAPSASPSIDVLSPSNWPAGSTNFVVQIHGPGFGCTPTVSLSDNQNVNIVAQSNVPDPNGNVSEIDITINVNINAPSEPVDVFVTNNDGGIGGGASMTTASARNAPSVKGATATSPATKGAASASRAISSKTASSTTSGVLNIAPTPAFLVSPPAIAELVAVAAPTPQIMFLGQDIANNAQPPNIGPQIVYVGQQITLTAQINLPQAVKIASETWSTPADISPVFGSLPQGTAIAGYDDNQVVVVGNPKPSTTGGFVHELKPTTCGTNNTCPYNSFYWVDQAQGRTFTFSYQLANGQQASATATFNVQGPVPNGGDPNGPTITADDTGSSVQALNVANHLQLILVGKQVPGGQVGIEFTATTTAPQANAGAYSWVQLLNTDTLTFLSPAHGFETCTTFKSLPNVPPDLNTPQLDTGYPYSAILANGDASDNPEVRLTSPFNEVTRAFAATMYSLWKPNDANGCQAAPGQPPCAIPIPLGSVNWRFKGDAINTQVVTAVPPAPNWIGGCGANLFGNNSHDQCKPIDVNNGSSGFPVWSNTGGTQFTDTATGAACNLN